MTLACAQRRLLLSTTLFVAAVTLLPSSARCDAWQAGVAAVVITPPQPMPMAGYASRGAQHAEDTLTDLYAKALVLQDVTGRRAVLITLDLVGLERELSCGLCDRVSSAFGFAREEIVLACSHTHTGPVVARNLRPMHYALFDAADRELVDDYSRFLEVQIHSVVAGALAKLAPAELSWGAGTATFATNRRNNPEAAVPTLRAAGELRGPFDHAVPVLAVHQQSQLVAVVFGYACHCTVLSSLQWSGDYAGFAQAELEARHPGCIALFWAGCGGDQNPLPRRTVELARQYGTELAQAVDVVLSGERRRVTGWLGTSYAEIPLAFGELPTRATLDSDRASSSAPVAARARALLQQLDAGQPLPETYPYPVTLWRVGDELQWWFLGGEVVVDYAQRIQAELASTDAAVVPVWVAAYSQDVMAYIPSRRVLLEGGYEGATAMIYYGRPTIWSEQVEEQILAEVHRQAGVKPAAQPDKPRAD